MERFISNEGYYNITIKCIHSHILVMSHDIYPSIQLFPSERNVINKIKLFPTKISKLIKNMIMLLSTSHIGGGVRYLFLCPLDQCRTGIKGPGRELFDGGPILNNIELWGPCWTLVIH